MGLVGGMRRLRGLGGRAAPAIVGQGENFELGGRVRQVGRGENCEF